MRMSAPTSTLVTTSETPLPAMTSRVDPQGARRMMEMLVNLYSDRRLAVVREYVSNAVDATRVAGSTEAVRVTVPTQLDPTLTVSDHGIGMSTSDVEATFLAFAASTKRGSDELIGGLGIGAKCAWALAESFLVDTVKNGSRTTVRASRDLAHQVLLAGEPSDLPDGTTITVPVEVGTDSEGWRTVINGVASAHPEGAVLVDGETVPTLDGGPTWIGPISCRGVGGQDNLSVTIRSGGTLFASVPEVTRRVLQVTKLLDGCLIELPIGTFDHTPSRETVIATDRTFAAVDAALNAYEAAYAALEKRVVDLAENDVPAAVFLRESILGTAGTPQHLPIPFHIEVPAELKSWKFGSSYIGRHRWVRIDKVPDTDTFVAIEALAAFTRTVLVTEVPRNRRLQGFATVLNSENPHASRVIPVPEGQASVALSVLDDDGNPTGQTWEIDANTPGITHYTFAEWKAKTGVGAARGPASKYQCVLVATDGAAPTPTEFYGSEIAELGLPVWYTDGDRPHRTNNKTPAVVEVYLGKRKEGPLLAAVPHAVTRSVWIETQFAAETAGWSEIELLAAALSRSTGAKMVFKIAASALVRTHDSASKTALLEVPAAILAASETTTTDQANLMNRLRDCTAVRDYDATVEHLRTDLVQAYPLLAHLRHWGPGEEFVDYLAHTPPRPIAVTHAAELDLLLDGDLANAA